MLDEMSSFGVAAESYTTIITNFCAFFFFFFNFSMTNRNAKNEFANSDFRCGSFVSRMTMRLYGCNVRVDRNLGI